MNQKKTNPKIDSFIGLMNEDGAVKSSMGDECTMIFTLCAYTKNGQALIEEEVVVRKSIPDFDYSTAGLEPLTIVEFTGEIESSNGKNKVNIQSVVKTRATHPQLEEVLKRRIEPVIFESAYFGKFILNRGLAWYENTVKWQNREVYLYLNVEQYNVNEIESQALQLFDKQSEWDRRFKDKIVEDLLELKNDSWLAEEEKPLTEKEFIEKVELQSVTMDGDGDFEVWFHDGDIFWGHSICLDGNLDGQLHEAGIQG